MVFAYDSLRTRNTKDVQIKNGGGGDRYLQRQQKK